MFNTKWSSSIFELLLSANRPKYSTDTVIAVIGANVCAITLRHDVPLIIHTLDGPGLLDTVLPGAGAPRLEAGAGVTSVHVGVLVTDTMRVALIINTFVCRVPSYRRLRIILWTKPL